MKTAILLLAAFASIARGDNVPLVLNAASAGGWYRGAISFGFEAGTTPDDVTAVLREAPPSLSDSPFVFTLRQFSPDLVGVPLDYARAVYYTVHDDFLDNEPDLSASSIYLQTPSFGLRTR